MTAWNELARLEYTIPPETHICLTNRFALDSSRSNEWKQYGKCLKLRGELSWDETPGPAPEFNREEPDFQSCMPDESSTDEQLWEYYTDHYRKACFPSSVFQLFENVKNIDAQRNLLQYSDAILDATAEYNSMKPSVQDMVKPARELALCIQALLRPVPFSRGCSPENVWFCFGEPSKSNKTAAIRCKLLTSTSHCKTTLHQSVLDSIVQRSF